MSDRTRTVTAIIPAAGSGERLGGSVPKPLIELNGKPMIVHTLQRLDDCLLIDDVVLVGREDQLNTFGTVLKKHKIRKVTKIIRGGATRSESVERGLEEIGRDCDIVVVHDGARPLAPVELFERCIKACWNQEAVISAVPLKPTVKVVDTASMTVRDTPNRSTLWEVQTPQVFKRDVLILAHQKKQSQDATDDAALVEAIGVPVHVISGDYKNIKVTTADDVTMAEQFLG